MFLNIRYLSMIRAPVSDTDRQRKVGWMANTTKTNTKNYDGY